jgi:glycosyltransferase involved in cell wall biosynthesis
MRVGIDYRPALVNGEGIGRYARELVRALVELELDRELGLFGYTLARARFSRAELGLARSQADLVRLRFPARWLPGLMRRLGKGADDLVGGAEVFHHTQYNALPVRLAVETAMIFDCIYLYEGAGYVEPAVAVRMTAAARELVARARRVLVPTHFVGAEVVLALGAHPARVSVTELGCDHIARHLPPEGFPRASEPFVLTASRVDARKNHLRMLEAFERLVKEGLPQRWLIVGPRGYGAEVFERALAQSPARERVEWRGMVSDGELAQLYAQCDCFLFASLNEGFGLPPLEAMACGAPVVASAVTALPEVCGEAALLVEPTDSERIFEAARTVLREPELTADLRRRGAERARQFTWRKCAKETVLAWRNALREGESEPRLRHTL